MSYKTIYTISFKSIDNQLYTIDIQKKDYTGNARALTASGNSPFVCTIDDEKFIYTPTRLSTATIRIVGGDYLQDLYSVDYQQFKVNLLRDRAVVWCGFIKPEVYTQEYASSVFELEIECVSAFSSLDNVPYSKKENGKLNFVSIFDLIKRAVSASNGSYRHVYIPHVYARSKEAYANIANVLNSMTLSEQNFFDEDEKPMKWLEVVEEACKFLNWTCCDWCGSLYFLDADHNGKYYKYDIDLMSSVYVSFNEMMVNNIGFSGSAHALDIIGGYNKATVKCNNYSIGTVVPNEEFDKLKRIKVTDDYKESNTHVCRTVFLNPDKWDLKIFDSSYNTISKTEIENYANVLSELEGATLVRYCTYSQSKDDNGVLQPDITDYSYTDVIRVKCVSSSAGNKVERLKNNSAHCKAMSFKGASSTYSDGAIAISGSIKALKDSLIPWGNSTSVGKTEIACQIRIGDMYYGDTLGSYSNYKWTNNKDAHVILQLESNNNNASLDFVPIENKKKLSMPYNGLHGFIIPINTLLSGEFEFSLYVVGKQNNNVIGYMIKDFKVSYQKDDDISEQHDESDRVYENVPNGNYINELEEIVMKISSYNNDGACYGKVLLYDEYLTNNLYSSILETQIRPEEQLLNRIIEQYCATKTLLMQVIKNNDSITPLTRLTDRHMSGKKFLIVGGVIDYYSNNFNCKMIEVC